MVLCNRYTIKTYIHIYIHTYIHVHTVVHVHLVNVGQHQAVKVNVQATFNLVIFVVINVPSILVLHVYICKFFLFLWIQCFP